MISVTHNRRPANAPLADSQNSPKSQNAAQKKEDFMLVTM